MKCEGREKWKETERGTKNGDKNDEKKHDLIIQSAHKVSGTDASRSPRILQEGSKSILYWLSSDTGGPHISTASVQSLDITTSDPISPEVSSMTRTVLPVPQEVGTGFPGFYPPFNFPTCPFLLHFYFYPF